jgi:hypothetical protein
MGVRPDKLGGFLTSRAQRRAALAVGVLLSGVGFLPLFGGPGYEHALASGLIVPSAAAIATSLELNISEPPGPLSCVGRGVLSGLALAALAFVTALAHGLRVGICDLWGGSLDFVLTAGFGSVLGGIWGVLVAEVVRGRKVRPVLIPVFAVGAPLAGVVISAARFYTSPMIFAFDPFAGFFAGASWDTVVDAGVALWTYRLGSLGTLLAVVFAASVLVRDARGRLRLGPLLARPDALVRALLAILAAAVSIGVTALGAKLGHWETPATIAAELGASRSGARCDVVLPDTVLPEDSDLIVKDCDEELVAVEKALGAKGPERVRAYFFRDAGEKKRLMGAGDTYIAKPWRKEVYLQLSGYPHPVLGHELAHVVAGSFANGPFHVAGALGGLWPNPGLIEGVAVAASPDDDELTDGQWAHAMMDLGTLPPVEKLFSFGFFSSSSAKSYTLAGAFVRWTIERFGTETVRAWYGGGSIERLTGKSWGELDLAFRKDIGGTPLLPEATTYAKGKFERGAIFWRKCPHVVDALRQHADQCYGAHQIGRAVELYDEVLAKDPHDWNARYGLWRAELTFGNAEKGRQGLRALADDPDAPRTWRDRTLDTLADDALQRGDLAGAAAIYASLAERSLDEDVGRMEAVKAVAATDPEARAPVSALLVGQRQRGGDFALAASLLGAWEERTGSPLASFLLGKNLSQRGWRKEGAPHLDRVIAAGGGGMARVAREAIRDRAIDACASGDAETVRRLEALVLDDLGPFAKSGGRRSAVLRLLARCTVLTGAPTGGTGN